MTYRVQTSPEPCKAGVAVLQIRKLQAKRVGDLCEVTLLVSSRAGIQPQLCWFQGSQAAMQENRNEER